MGKVPSVMQKLDLSPGMIGRRLRQITARPPQALLRMQLSIRPGSLEPFFLATEPHVRHLITAVGLHILVVSYSEVSRLEQSLMATAGPPPELR